MEIRERITVGAVFQPGGMRPAWFVWRGRRYAVGEVNYSWESREGAARLRHFSVASGANIYELSYNPLEYSWEIQGVEQDWRG